MKEKLVHLIGYASGMAANNSGCCIGPMTISNSEFLTKLSFKCIWDETLFPKEKAEKLAATLPVTEICTRLADLTEELTQNQSSFAIIGGDHSCAIGTWSGVAHALRHEGDIGLIWLDAHMDSHTPETSHTGNIHGMPLATLLGHGAESLTQILDQNPKLKPENTVLMGIRSYESEEVKLLTEIGARVYYMDEIKEKGFETCYREALALINKNTVGYGISFDLDCIDPGLAPGVGTPVEDGLKKDDVLTALHSLSHQYPLLGLEITEFNPNLDKDKLTEKLTIDLLEAIFSRT